ncbi:MAG TPA: GreA/GreB family elongation factor [Pseudonocardiaceae bacterium]|jgi:transcription elongation factor GreA|nr:GreA/GreB family elongation factor [Pseudonocardiaceae bacterium]
MPPASGPTSSDGSEWTAATRARLEQELARVRDERRGLATSLAGEDPRDPEGGDSGDQADLLEYAEDLARMDRRITEIGHLLVGSRPDAAEDPHGPEDGTVVTLRFADGTVATFRVVAITEEVPEDRQDEVLTLDSPLGRALAGRHVGDTIIYSAPDGEAHAEVVAMQPPSTSE